MNLLQLVQRVYLESGKSGAGPVTLDQPSKDVARIMGWVDDAWLALQTDSTRRWDWMQASMDGLAPTGVVTHTATTLGVANFGRWRVPSKAYTVRAFDPLEPGNVWRLRFMPLDQFTSAVLDHPVAPGPPNCWTVGHAQQLMVGPAGDRDYMLRADYSTAAQRLSAETDEPNMPEDLHMYLVWRALVDAGRQSVAAEVVAAAADKESELWDRLVNRHQVDRLSLDIRPLG